MNTYFISPPRIFLWEKLIGNPEYNGECFMDLNQEFELRRENVGNCLSTVRRTNGAVAVFFTRRGKKTGGIDERRLLSGVYQYS